MSIESLLTTKVIEAVKQCYDADVDKDKVQLQATRKEFAGVFRRNLRKRRGKNWGAT